MGGWVGGGWVGYLLNICQASAFLHSSRFCFMGGHLDSSNRHRIRSAGGYVLWDAVELVCKLP